MVGLNKDILIQVLLEILSLLSIFSSNSFLNSYPKHNRKDCSLHKSHHFSPRVPECIFANLLRLVDFRFPFSQASFGSDQWEVGGMKASV